MRMSRYELCRNRSIFIHRALEQFSRSSEHATIVTFAGTCREPHIVDDVAFVREALRLRVFFEQESALFFKT